MHEYEPTPEEIARVCKLIQMFWTPEEREKRVAWERPGRQPPKVYQVHMPRRSLDDHDNR